MNRPEIPFLILYLLSVVATASAQQTELQREKRMEELVESFSSGEEATSEGSLLLEDINHYINHPVYVNQANEEELTRINLLNFKQIRSILSYREKYGKIMTPDELSIAGDLTTDILQKIEPYILYSVEADSVQKRRDNYLGHSLLVRAKRTFPTAVGFLPSKGKPPVYPGNPYGYFARYRAEVGKWLELGLTAENDAGEDFFRASNKSGFDFLSGFVSLNRKGWLRKIVIGDFHLRFGQGVNLWSGGGVSYVSDLSSMMRSGEGIRPYSSTDENQFFRGLATQFCFNPVKIFLFYSDRKRDANLDSTAEGENVITSLRLDGLHRTLSEIGDEKNVHIRMMGGYADFRFERWRFGFLGSCQQFGVPITKGDMLYKSKTFEGDVNLNFGVDYHLIFNQISLFGEAGFSQNMKPAIVNGMVWKAHPQLSFSFLYRNYNPAFQSFNAGSFGEGSGSRNEQGLYCAFEFFPVSKLKIGGQADLFYFPWMTYQTITPSNGRSLAFQTEFTLNSSLMVYLHGRFSQKPQKLSGATGVPEQWDEFTSKWRLHCDWKLNDRFQLRTRMEYVGYKYNSKRENGFLTFQDLIYTASPRLKSWLRITLYKTESYNSRVYSYENDLLYYFAIPEFHGTGIRSYLNLKWQPIRAIALYYKVGYTLRQGASSMGSGNDASPGDHRFDVRGQIFFKF
jgi:hypothetical protein